jgi:hypothetical protein
LNERVLAADQLKITSRNQPRGEHYKIFWLNLHVDMGQQSIICQQSFWNMLEIFKHQYRTIWSSATSLLPGPITHGNSGKQNCFEGSNKKAVEDDVVSFLNKIADDSGKSYETQFI